MKTTTKQVLHGLEASRRVGWAKFYEEKSKRDTERDDLLAENAQLKWLVRLLIKRIVFHERLHNDDSLVILAKELEKSV
jgi:hypothetical protein